MVRVALVHSFYRADQPSGENLIVEQQVAELRTRGHRVLLVAVHSDEARGVRFGRLQAAADVVRGTGHDPTRQLREFGPDVVHVHNLFPNFATRWLARWPGPLVATLHNYRPLCANALLWRAGNVCTSCPDGHRWAGVRHGCYRGSALATLPLAVRNRNGLQVDPLVSRADLLIALSHRAMDTYTRYGAPADRLRLIPNGIRAEPPVARGTESGSRAPRWVALGRLTPEKGLDRLLRDWPQGAGLDIIGSGPEEARLRGLAGPSIRFLGRLDRTDVRRRLPQYRAAVFNGVNPEGAYPLAAVESLAAGLPLVARQGGAAADMARRWGCGVVFTSAADLPPALADSGAAALRTAAVETFSTTFALEPWLKALEGVYAEACAAP